MKPLSNIPQSFQKAISKDDSHKDKALEALAEHHHVQASIMSEYSTDFCVLDKAMGKLHSQTTGKALTMRHWLMEMTAPKNPKRKLFISVDKDCNGGAVWFTFAKDLAKDDCWPSHVCCQDSQQ